MDDARCKYVNKPCANARSLKDDGTLHRLCTFHRSKANDAQRRWHSRRRHGVKRRAGDDVSDADDRASGGTSGSSGVVAGSAMAGGMAAGNGSAMAHAHAPVPVYGHPHTHAPRALQQPLLPPPPHPHAHLSPSPSPKRRYVGPQELPALAEVMMMLRQQRPEHDLAFRRMQPPHEAPYVIETPWSTRGSVPPPPPPPPPPYLSAYEPYDEARDARRPRYHDNGEDQHASRSYGPSDGGGDPSTRELV